MKSWKEHYWYSVPIMRTRIEEIVKKVNGRGKTVLEAGCNEGFLSMALKEDGCSVFPLDKDEQMINKAKENFNLDVTRGDVNNLPFPDNFFDIAVGGELLEHIPNPFLGLSELFRVSKEKVVISIPVGSYWLGEKTHIWEINASLISHDSSKINYPFRDTIVLSFTKRRDNDLLDIPPFDTDKHFQKEVAPYLNQKEG